ncbi:MAG: hypothetical protein ACXU9U_04285, partial [Parachlamydiaceae bacterium]
MSLKQFPFFLLYLVSSISLADYSAPASVQGNVNLIKSAIGQLKNIGDQVISHINQTQKLASFCGQLRVNGIQNLDPQFKEFQGKDLRSQIS